MSRIVNANTLTFLCVCAINFVFTINNTSVFLERNYERRGMLYVVMSDE